MTKSFVIRNLDDWKEHSQISGSGIIYFFSEELDQNKIWEYEENRRLELLKTYDQDN